MTDKELLELAAKAAGIEVDFGMQQWNKYWVIAEGFWNPLTDDGDALRLAVKLSLQPLFNDDLNALTIDYQVEPEPFTVLCESYGNDKYAATRRAIVRAAAEIGMMMK